MGLLSCCLLKLSQLWDCKPQLSVMEVSQAMARDWKLRNQTCAQSKHCLKFQRAQAWFFSNLGWPCFKAFQTKALIRSDYFPSDKIPSTIFPNTIFSNFLENPHESPVFWVFETAIPLIWPSYRWCKSCSHRDRLPSEHNWPEIKKSIESHLQDKTKFITNNKLNLLRVKN